MHYPAGSARKYPLTANLRAHILSVRSPQPRYIVRGTKGTYTKFGVDVQEDQLKAMASPNGIFEDGFGREPEALWGTVENIEADDVSVRKTVYVLIPLDRHVFWIFSTHGLSIVDGPRQTQDLKSIFSEIWQVLSETVLNSL